MSHRKGRYRLRRARVGQARPDLALRRCELVLLLLVLGLKDGEVGVVEGVEGVDHFDPGSRPEQRSGEVIVRKEGEGGSSNSTTCQQAVGKRESGA